MKRLSLLFISIGLILVIPALFVLTLTFYPILKVELGYIFSKHDKKVSLVKKANVIVPVDTKFGIVIPKIGANAHVIPNIDPFDEPSYQRALTRGVAHAKGTSFPGENGNIFLFAHSSVDFYEALKYNSIFYLISKLEKNDEVILFYNGREYKYKVSEKKTVNPSDVSYLSTDYKLQTSNLILMTCWPPGTTLNRLLIIASLSK